MAIRDRDAAAPPYSAIATELLRLPEREAIADQVAVEEPLEIRIGGRPVAVTMRTPGHDEELAVGFCLSEGLRPLSARLPDDLAANAVDVEAPGLESRLTVTAALVAALPDRLRAAQATFEATGGLHATGLFDEEGE